MRKRPHVTQQVIDGFAAILDAQDDKGFEKYGCTIDDAKDSNYDWKTEALEEFADYSKYLVRQIKQLEAALQAQKPAEEVVPVKIKNGRVTVISWNGFLYNLDLKNTEKRQGR